MAKKQKQKKTGMLKRKAAKANRKAGLRRKNASRAPMRPTNEKELLKVLGKIPLLAYESALDGLEMNGDQLKAGLEAKTSSPQLILQLAEPAWLEGLRGALTTMGEELPPTNPKGMMVQGILHAFDSEEMQPFVNPLVVAIFLKSKAAALGEELTQATIISAVDDYEKENEEEIEVMMEAIAAVKKGAESLVAEVQADEADDGIEDGVLVKDTIEIDPKLMKSYKATLSSFDDDRREAMEEDLELFLEDFLEVELSELNAKAIDGFLGGWFIKTANPLEEDMDSMQSTLEHFFTFLKEGDTLGKEAAEGIITTLKDRDTYRQRLKA